MTLEEKRQLYQAAVEAAGLELKGKNNLYTSANGNMQSFIGKDGVGGLRFSAQDRDRFMKQHGVGQPVQYNTVMKDYVEISDELLKDTASLASYLKRSYDYVSSLPAKPTKR